MLGSIFIKKIAVSTGLIFSSITLCMEKQFIKTENVQEEQSRLYGLLCKSAKKLDVEGVLNILKLGVIPNSDLPVLLATAQLMMVMIEFNKNYNFDEIHNCTKKAKKIVKNLAENGFNINGRNCKGQTPLIMAAIFGNKGLAKTLIKLKAQRDLKDHNNLTAIQYAEQDTGSFITIKSDIELYVFIRKYPYYEDNRKKIATMLKEK